MRQPKRISEISWVVGTSDEDIRRLYRRVHSVQEQLIDLEDLERRSSGFTIRALEALHQIIWPSLERVEMDARLSM